MSESVQNLFDQFLNTKPLFADRNALSISFTPENVPHREKQMKDLAKILAPALRGERPSNVFIYGRTGTGKSLISTIVADQLRENKNGRDINIIYVNCKLGKTADTEYRLLATLIKEMGKEVPFTGLPTQKLYRTFFELVDRKEQIMILLIDEIDTLVRKNGDGILYNLTRGNEGLKKAKISVVGITNDLGFIDNLDPRVRSSLSEEELIFPPYNAVQLQEILRDRATHAFDPTVMEAGVIEKCAALAAQEHGDARRALDLLRVAGEIAERNGDSRVKITHVDMAEDKIDLDRTVEMIRAQPKHSQAVLLSIMQLSEDNRDVQTADVMGKYHEICSRNSLRTLTQRRVGDLIAELDLFGVIVTKVISKGRYGRTRVINLNISELVKKRISNLINQSFC